MGSFDEIPRIRRIVGVRSIEPEGVSLSTPFLKLGPRANRMLRISCGLIDPCPPIPGGPLDEEYEIPGIPILFGVDFHRKDMARSGALFPS